MLLFLSFLAAVGCAVSNGIAAILEKIGANRQTRVNTINLGFLWKLSKSTPYLIGIVLDLLAWVLTLVAVHNLPLFVVQPIIGCSIIVTIVVEHFLFKHPLNLKFVTALIVIIAGLVLLAFTSSPEKSSIISNAIRWGILLAPIILLLIGYVAAKFRNRYSTYTLAGISGLAFGGVSISGRAISFTAPYLHVLSSPLFWIILAYGLLGILFFTIALQRSSATSVSSTMIGGETILPILIGISFLGDHPRNSLWLLMVFGIILTFVGTLYISLNSTES